MKKRYYLLIHTEKNEKRNNFEDESEKTEENIKQINVVFQSNKYKREFGIIIIGSEKYFELMSENQLWSFVIQLK